MTAILCPLSYFLYTGDVHFRFFDVRDTLAAYQRGKQGEIFPVTVVTDQNGRDWTTIPAGATTLNPYEPIFGYRLEDFHPKTHSGSIFEVTNGFFNMTNPASLVFPKTNGGTTFSLFTAAQKEKLISFAERRQPDWGIPKIQIVFNIISAITFLLALAIIFRNTSLITRFFPTS